MDFFETAPFSAKENISSSAAWAAWVRGEMLGDYGSEVWRNTPVLAGLYLKRKVRSILGLLAMIYSMP